jgi:putative sterol carrier protein
MDEATLKRLGDKTISPWYATLTGKLSWNGSLFTAKKMESNVISRYEDIKINNIK